jgi:hypothetical protein
MNVCAAAIPVARERDEVVRLRGHDVLGQLEVGGARLLGLRDLERLADDLGHDVRRVDPRVPLRDRRHHRDDVEVLVRLLVHALKVALAGERDERRPVEVRVCDGGDEVRRPRAEGSQADAGAPGEPADHVRHVRTALLVAHREELMAVPYPEERCLTRSARTLPARNLRPRTVSPARQCV